MWPALANVTVAIWLLASSLFLRQTRPEILNAGICALLTTVSAVTGLFSRRPMRLPNVIVGLWLMFGATILPHATAASAWNHGIVGYVLLMVAFIPHDPPHETKPTGPLTS